MTNSEERSPPAVGAYWINESDYPALLEIFPDGNRMPRAWAEWRKIAEEMEVDARHTGTSSCVLTSIRTHFRIGAPLMARVRAVKDARGS